MNFIDLPDSEAINVASQPAVVLPAKMIGAFVINIYGGGVYDNKQEALKRFIVNLNCLSDSAHEKVTPKNDDQNHISKLRRCASGGNRKSITVFIRQSFSPMRIPFQCLMFEESIARSSVS